MAAKSKTISTLIESQLPAFISNDYPQFSKFVEKYYEQLENKGQPLDIIGNITKYRDINSYENSLLEQSTVLSSSVANDTTNIQVESTATFPEKNGYIKIGNEICFYKEKTDTEFKEVSRGVSGNTTLGDLYNKSNFVTTQAEPHYQGDVVYNISHLFLYALVKSFESQYLGAFPEKYLKPEVDKRTLIKNIGKFYKSKGTDKSVRFIFNSIISKDPTEKVSTYNPSDFTLKGSTSDWISNYSLKVRVTSGDVNKLIGNTIIQKLDDYDTSITYASAVVDNVIYAGKSENEDIYELILQPSSINGSFRVFSKTKLKTSITSTDTAGDRITVSSTLGWPKVGKLLIGNEVFSYVEKNVNQFVISERSSAQNHAVDKIVYNYSTLEGTHEEGTVSLITVGVVYNLLPKVANPYSESGDYIQISDPGFDTRNPILYNNQTEQIRWVLNPTFEKAFSSTSSINSQINQLVSDVSSIYEDDQYYYICSSSYPSYNLLNSNVTEELSDQKILKLIRKFPTTTTEVYSTSTRDVGILVDGSPAFGYKDSEFVRYGKIVNVTIDSKGQGYKASPTVLINNEPGKARAVLSGEVVDSIIIDTNEIFETSPEVTITSGRGAVLNPVITNGKITSITVVNPGEYYTSPPIIRISDDLGKGNFAEYEAVLTPDGKIDSCRRISGGRFYTRGNTRVTVDAVGFGAQGTANIRKWTKNRYYKLQLKLDQNNGYAFVNYNLTRNYGYGVVANPLQLRYKVSDNLNSASEPTNTLVHSPILGYAYDGNPIYGPYGYADPTDPTSPIVRLSSGYVLKNNRVDGPNTVVYPLGSLIDDYQWVPSVNSGKTELDPNNGRFCITPDYPKGIYAYFVTIDTNNKPAFPYIIGENYYSLPVDSNYNSNISQDDLPFNVKKLRTDDIDSNGSGFRGIIQDTKSGTVTSATIYDTPNNFSVKNEVIIDNSLTEGFGASAIVSSVTGKNVLSIESKDTKAVKISVKEISYLFEGDIIVQKDSNGDAIAAGELIGDCFNDRTFVLRDCENEFNLTDKLFSETKVVNLILDKNATFTKGSILTLTDGKDLENSDIATGEVLEGSNKQNSIKLKVTSPTDFIVDDDYFIKSNNLSDTTRAKVINVISLSENLSIFTLDEDIAIVTTDEDHKLAVDDKVSIDIIPNDNTTETVYYVRKRLYQRAILNDIKHKSKIIDRGVGRVNFLNTGLDYTAGTYTNIELVFRDQSLARNNIGSPGDIYNAKATIVIASYNGSGFGGIQSITITSKGFNYKKGDILTVSDEDLFRLPDSVNNQRILLEVDHVGLAKSNTFLQLDNVNNLSIDDHLKIGEEICKITAVNVQNKYVTITRGEKGTTATDHYDQKEVELYQAEYRFNQNLRPFGDGANKPYLISYDTDNNQVAVSYDYGTNTPIKLLLSSTFYDSSSPAKLVSVKSVDDPVFKLEFTRDNVNIITNPIVKVQKYYKYKFDTSHYSMANTFLDFSASSNYNIFTEEKYTNNIPPGNTGSFLSVKFGFGPNLGSNTSTEKRRVNYSNYFYFIKASGEVVTEDSYLEILDDPLAGDKTVIYSTDNRFVYSLVNTPEYDGSGTITYTTTSQYAVGKIHKIDIINTGTSYKRIPIVSGVVPTIENECIAEVVYDSIGKKIFGVKIINQGKNYSKPAIAIVNGDGTGARFSVKTLDGKVKEIKVEDSGSNYTYTPTIKVIESDAQIYLNSKDIGAPQNVKIITNGASYNNDNTTLPVFNSNTIFVLKNFVTSAFSVGEEIYQESTGARARVSKNGWRPGSNLLKVDLVRGIFDNNSTIKGLSGKNTALLVDQISTEFNADIKSYSDNLGFYVSDRGKLSANSQKLTDSYFYQDYSYVIKSKTPIDVWRDLIRETTHPAGFQMFGEILIETSAESTMPTTQRVVETYSCISLPPVNVEIIDTVKQISVSTLSVNVIDIQRGIGSVSVDTFDSSETFVREIGLATPFNGDFSLDTSKPEGDTSFTMYDKKNNLPITISKAEQLIVSLDGVIQEPGEAFTVSGTSISFASAPLGDRISEGQLVESQKFYGRLIRFKSASLNNKYFRKFKDISNQFNGIDIRFDLKTSNNQIVKTDPSENLLVFLNGVLQKAKINEDTPYGNSYYIDRSDNESETDQIVFSKPPLNPVTTEDLPEKCFIYSIGSYQRLTIDSNQIEYRKEGPYLIIDEVTNRVVKIDDPLYALVFIDGVLQEENKSYNIVGPNITFTSPLKKYTSESGEEQFQNVSIILAYGRDVEKTLTFYDFENDTYFNEITLSLNGSNLSSNFDTLTYQYSNHSPEWYSQKVFVYQDDLLIGELKRVEKQSSTLIDFTILSALNLVDLTQDNITFVVNNQEYTLSGSYSVSYSYTRNEDGERILIQGKQIPLWYYGSEYTEQEPYKITRSLNSGDFIRIDGEEDYREIISIPEIAKPKNYIPGEIVSSDLYAKIRATNYNGITRGEGLSINAILDNDGSIIKLEWNQKDLDLYFNNGVLLQPTAYQYYIPPIVEFIPQTEDGGGARAEVISYGGQILDIVLIDGGYGYTEPPRVIVGRGFDKINSSFRRVGSSLDYTIVPKIPVLVQYYSTSISQISAGVDNLSYSSSLVFGEINSDRQITSIILPPQQISSLTYLKTEVYLNTAIEFISTTITGLSPDLDSNITVVVMPEITVDSIVTTSREIDRYVDVGLFDYLPNESFGNRYGLENAGWNIGLYDNNVFINSGSSNVSNFTLEEFEYWYPNVTINEFESRKLSRYFEQGEILDLVPSSVQEFGTYLDSPHSDSATVIYVTSTKGFPSEGFLVMNNEIIRYTGKESDRFTGVTRGFRTVAQSHSAGDYIRSIEFPEWNFYSVLNPGPG